MRDIRAFEQALRSLEGAEIPNGWAQPTEGEEGGPPIHGDGGTRNAGFAWCFGVFVFFWKNGVQQKNKAVCGSGSFPEMEWGK